MNSVKKYLGAICTIGSIVMALNADDIITRELFASLAILLGANTYHLVMKTKTETLHL